MPSACCQGPCTIYFLDRLRELELLHRPRAEVEAEQVMTIP